ncbi:MAG: MerR family transcriptional regulator [Lachnospiraceae bacterium]|nr:MerR family transcriptional regulator [Lachnospiraceae bacterium]
MKEKNKSEIRKNTDPKSKLLTIGQFAAMHGINKKTLMWYDEIGLFHPAFIHPENGYRYYSYHQSPILETILLLRELDVSLEVIQKFMEHRSAKKLKCLLEEKIGDLDRHLVHLQAVRNTLCSHHQNMVTLLTMDLSKISIVAKEERRLVTVEIDPDISFEKEVELITAETEKYQLGRLHDASYGSMISVSSLQKGDFHNYSKLFIDLPVHRQIYKTKNTAQTGLHLQPGGSYLRAFHKGNWDKIPKRYQEVLHYAAQHGLTLSGYSYEMGINENVIDRVEDYIVQIEIPIASSYK